MTDDDGCQPIAIGHPSDSGDLKSSVKEQNHSLGKIICPKNTKLSLAKDSRNLYSCGGVAFTVCGTLKVHEHCKFIWKISVFLPPILIWEESCLHFKIKWTAALYRASNNQILAKTDDIHSLVEIISPLPNFFKLYLNPHVFCIGYL